jgi:outer membrane receptor protein involved in Fe transport
VSGAYQYDLARVVEATLDPSLGIPSTVGNLLPQVPKHRGTLQVTYTDPRLVTVSVNVQATGLQYDDDQNTRVLGKYAVVGFSVSRDLDRNIQLFIGGQNIFNQAYAVATLPTLLGSPRIISGGVRVNLH